MLAQSTANLAHGCLRSIRRIFPMDIGLLALHAIPGLLFMGHGAQKLFGVMGGHGIDGTGGFFEKLGLRPGRVHAFAAGFRPSDSKKPPVPSMP